MFHANSKEYAEVPKIGDLLNLERLGVNSVANKKPFLEPDRSEQVTTLHDNLTIIDLHADSLLWPRDLLKESKYGHIDIPRLIKGNVAIQVFAAVTKTPIGVIISPNTVERFSDLIVPLSILQNLPVRTWFSTYERARYQARKLKLFEKESKGKFTLIKNKEILDDYLYKRETNKKMTAGILALEGIHPIKKRMKRLKQLIEDGYRIIGPSHFFDNSVSGSAHGLLKYGLTKFGEKVIKYLNDNHIIIDLAHASKKAIDDILKITTGPLISSHGGVDQLCSRGERNMIDKHIKAIAKRGGVIGIGYWETAVCGNKASDTVKAINYIVNLTGSVDNVALGSDFDGLIKAHFDTSHINLITQELIKNNYSDDEIAKIMGGNSLRVIKEVLK